MIVKIIGQQTSKTFQEFATNVCKHIMSFGVEFKAEKIDIVADRLSEKIDIVADRLSEKIDIVVDRLSENSLKGGTRKD